MKIRYSVAVCALLLAPSASHAQVKIESAPPEISLLNMFVRKWSAASPLGELRTRIIDDQDIEVRAWGGFGLTGTGATILRRTAGRWQAWRAIRHKCLLEVPVVGADTLTDEEIARYKVQARAQCDAPRPRLDASRTIIADTLAIVPVSVDAASIENAWKKAVDAGLLSLPGSPASKRMMLDGFTYVIELRIGRTYRAMEFQHIQPPENETDAQIQRVFAALTHLTP